MRQAKTIACGLFAVFLFGTLASSPAEAGWLVLGSLLAGSAAISPAVITHLRGTLKDASVEILCPTIAFQGAAISDPDKILIKSLEFSGCSVTRPFRCTVSGGKVATVPIEGLFTLNGTLGAKAKIKPETGNVLETIGFEGDECAQGGQSVPVTGSALLLAPQGQDASLWQLLNLTVETEDELHIGPEESIILGNALVRLENDMPWSFA